MNAKSVTELLKEVSNPYRGMGSSLYSPEEKQEIRKFLTNELEMAHAIHTHKSSWQPVPDKYGVCAKDNMEYALAFIWYMIKNIDNGKPYLFGVKNNDSILS